MRWKTEEVNTRMEMYKDETVKAIKHRRKEGN
jgi:hypothetical protein